MKFFIDTANVEAIKEALAIGILDGVTTNPTLLAKEGKNPEGVLKEILSIVKEPVSIEAMGTSAEELIKEATEISKKGKNAVVKIPLTTEGLKAIKVLSRKGIKTNATLVFSANQALLAAKAGATYVSPFIGRLDDRGENGMALVEEIVKIYKNYDFKTEIIVASIRSTKHVSESAKLGAHIATIPPNVIKELVRHELTDIGIKRFQEDWDSLKKVKNP